MFKRIKQLIDFRLGNNIAIEDINIGESYFIRISPEHLFHAAHFLKNDPDASLTLFHQMIVLDSLTLPWTVKKNNNDTKHQILYEIKSLTLPYEVTLVTDVVKNAEPLPSLTELYLGCHYYELDISRKFGIRFENSARLII